MKLEDQVCTLKQAKRLKKLGVKQDSYFVWQDFPETKYRQHAIELWESYRIKRVMDLGDSWCAFTVAELGELIDWNIVAVSAPYKDQREWFLCTDDHDEFHVNEARVRAAMLIYLLENKLM